MKVGNLSELGINLQKIVQRLTANEDLLKLLYYDNVDPLSCEPLSQEQIRKEVFNDLIKVVPRVVSRDDGRSVIAVRVISGEKDETNTEIINFQIMFDVVVPLTSWVIKDSNLRPFAILGEMQKSLEGRQVHGLGTLRSGDFRLSLVTDELGCYQIPYNLFTYD